MENGISLYPGQGIPWDESTAMIEAAAASKLKRLFISLPEYACDLGDIKGELSGWYEWSKGETWHKDYGIYKLRKDHHHLNKEGKYLQACVWIATLTGKNIADLAYAPDLGDDFRSRVPLIRRCAMDAASKFNVR